MTAHRQDQAGRHLAAEQDAVVDFGSVRLRIPPGARLQADQSGGESRLVRLATDEGRLDLCVLAAPRDSPLWPTMSQEVAASQAGKGAKVSIEAGEWGDEVLALTEAGLSRYVAKDGPRWMLFGLALGPEQAADRLGGALREAIRGSEVHRGSEPLPIKTALPITVADQPTSEYHQPPGAEPLMFRMAATAPLQRTAPPQQTAPLQRTAPPPPAGPAAVDGQRPKDDPTPERPSARRRPNHPTRMGTLTAAVVLMLAAAAGVLLIPHDTGHLTATPAVTLPAAPAAIPAQQPAPGPTSDTGPAAPLEPDNSAAETNPTETSPAETNPAATGPTPTATGAVQPAATRPSPAARNPRPHSSAPAIPDSAADVNSDRHNDHRGDDQHRSRHHDHATATDNDDSTGEGPLGNLTGTLGQLGSGLG
jgi:hypothetical protein